MIASSMGSDRMLWHGIKVLAGKQRQRKLLDAILAPVFVFSGRYPLSAITGAYAAIGEILRLPRGRPFNAPARAQHARGRCLRPPGRPRRRARFLPLAVGASTMSKPAGMRGSPHRSPFSSFRTACLALSLFGSSSRAFRYMRRASSRRPSSRQASPRLS